MDMLFKQRFFSWFDSYDIYDERGNTLFVVKGRLAWGHLLEIYDAKGQHIGTLKEEVLAFMPRFRLFYQGQYVGQIKKELTLFKPSFRLDCHGWHVQGDWFEWDYRILDREGSELASAHKQLLNFTDTYQIHVEDDKDAVICLMIVLAIDAVKCSNNS